jgi:hypothetical protein
LRLHLWRRLSAAANGNVAISGPVQRYVTLLIRIIVETGGIGQNHHLT